MEVVIVHAYVLGAYGAYLAADSLRKARFLAVMVGLVWLPYAVITLNEKLFKWLLK